MFGWISCFLRFGSAADQELLSRGKGVSVVSFHLKEARA